MLFRHRDFVQSEGARIAVIVLVLRRGLHTRLADDDALSDVVALFLIFIEKGVGKRGLHWQCHTGFILGEFDEQERLFDALVRAGYEFQRLAIDESADRKIAEFQDRGTRDRLESCGSIACLPECDCIS